MADKITNKELLAHSKKTALGYKENVSMTYRFLKDGKDKKYIEDYFDNTQGLSRQTVMGYIAKARRLLSSDEIREADFALAIHNNRYERIWEADKDIYVQWIPNPTEKAEFVHNNEILRKYREVLKSLKQRERLFGLSGSGETNVYIQNNISLNGKIEKQNLTQLENQKVIEEAFDFDKLDTQELSKLVKYFSIMRGQKEEQQFFFETEEDVEKQRPMSELEKQKSSKIIIESLPVEKIKEIKSDSIRETASIIVKGEHKEGKTPEQVAEELRKAMREKIKKKYLKS